MRVIFVESCEVEVINSFDEALDDAESSTEIFNPGDIIEFDILDPPTRFDGAEDTMNINVQFPDGSVCFGMSREWFNELT
jgi:hypothetical protein